LDDFAFRKGFRYGTLLVDLERGCPIDLLPDREGGTVEKWLKAHPGIEIVSRDRSMTYAAAIRQAAPQARAVADRFHLMKNLMEALEKRVSKEYSAIRQRLAPSSCGATSPADGKAAHEPAVVPATRWQEQRSQQSRQRRFANWQQVQELEGQGHTQEEIAQKVGIAAPTIRRYLRELTFAERRPNPCPPKKLDAYQEYLRRHWQEGCCNALQLWRELKEQGFTGGATSVREYVRLFG
jgi:transposase